MSFHICAGLLILSKVSIMRKIKSFMSCKLTRKTIVLGIQFSWKYFYETILWKNLKNNISSDNNIMKIVRTISKVNILLDNATNLSLYCDPKILIFYRYYNNSFISETKDLFDRSFDDGQLLMWFDVNCCLYNIITSTWYLFKKTCITMIRINTNRSILHMQSNLDVYDNILRNIIPLRL